MMDIYKHNNKNVILVKDLKKIFKEDQLERESYVITGSQLASFKKKNHINSRSKSIKVIAKEDLPISNKNVFKFEGTYEGPYIKIYVLKNNSLRINILKSELRHPIYHGVCIKSLKKICKEFKHSPEEIISDSNHFINEFPKSYKVDTDLPIDFIGRYNIHNYPKSILYPEFISIEAYRELTISSIISIEECLTDITSYTFPKDKASLTMPGGAFPVNIHKNILH